jgi:hypothetical protein
VLRRAELTEPECAVWDAVEAGTLAELPVGVPTPADPAEGGSWGDDRQVRAQLLYELLTANPDKDLRPRAKVVGARITGTLDLEAAELLCPVQLERCWFDRPVNLAEGAGPCTAAAGLLLPGLRAEQLTTTGNLELNKGFTATGEVRLHGAHIGGRLDFTTAALSNPEGPALDAGRLAVDQSMFCFDRFTANGEVNLGGAHIGGRLTFATATLSNPRGRALQAERLTVEQDLFFTEGFRATGEMYLAGAHVGGTLSFDGATLGSNHGALTLADLRATTLLLRPGAAPGCVDLTHAQVGVLADDPASWPAQIRLRGFTYDALHEHSTISASERLHDWVSRDLDGYIPEPFEQLAAVYRKGAAMTTLARCSSPAGLSRRPRGECSRNAPTRPSPTGERGRRWTSSG